MSLSDSSAARSPIKAVITTAAGKLAKLVGLARLQRSSIPLGSKRRRNMFTVIDQLETPLETLQGILVAEHSKPTWTMDDFGCITRESTRGATGYVSASLPGNNEYLPHQVAGVIKFKLKRQEVVDQVIKVMKADKEKGNGKSSSYDCSHLCHNKRCSNVEHIVLELHVVNVDRDICAVSEVCGCCGEVVVFCEHIPRCLNKP